MILPSLVSAVRILRAAIGQHRRPLPRLLWWTIIGGADIALWLVLVWWLAF